MVDRAVAAGTMVLTLTTAQAVMALLVKVTLVVMDGALSQLQIEQVAVAVAQVAWGLMHQRLQRAVTVAQAHHHLLRVHLLAEQVAVAVVVLQPQAQQPTVALMEIQAGLDLMLMQTVVEVVVAQVALLM
jgi:hypothetical protein